MQLTDFTDDRLLHHIYDAADEPEGLHAVMRTCSRLLESPKIHLMVLGPGGQPVVQAFAGGVEAEANEYLADWHAIDPRFHAAVARSREVLSDAFVLEPTSFEESSFYNDFMRTIGMRYTLFTLHPSHGDHALAMACMRPTASGHYAKGEVDALARLVPHLGRAGRLQAIAQSLVEQRQTLEAALDALPLMIALVDDGARVVHAGAAARRLLGEAEGVHISRDKLTALRTNETHRLRAAIQRAARFADAASQTKGEPPATSIRLARRDGSEDIVSVLPLRPQSAVRARSSQARALCILYDPRCGLSIDRLQLCELFDLTLAEADLAATLAEGGTLAEFVTRRRCSLETGRTHLKRTLGKVGARRQAELVHRVLRHVVLHRLPA